MKFTLVSDLHIDKHPLLPDLVTDENKDGILVVAGDTSNHPTISLDFILDQKKIFKEVIWIIGNHECWHTSAMVMLGHQTYPGTVPEIHEYLKANCDAAGVHYLNRSSVVIDGVEFAGAVGWHDFIAGEPYDTNLQMRTWANFKHESYIKWHPNSIPGDPHYVLKEAKLDVEYFRDAIAKSTNPMVIITHHLPHRDLITRRPVDHDWTIKNGIFVNTALEDVVGENAKIWCYGHTHQRGQRKIKDTNYLCNPRGTPLENPGWGPAVVTFNY